MRYAATLPKDESLSLCFGTTMRISWLPAEEEPSSTTEEVVYYLSIFHESKTVGIGRARTDLTIEVFSTKANARDAARKLASVWKYNVLDALEDKR